MTQPPPAMLPILTLAREGQWSEAYVRLLADPLLTADAAGQSFAGMLAGRLDKHGEAARWFASVLQAVPADRATRTNLVRSLVLAGDIEQARHWLDEPSSHALARLGGYVFHQMGDRETALLWYGRAVDLAPDDFESWNNIGNIRSELDQLDPAIAAYEQAITLRRDLPEPYLNLISLLGRYDRNEARLRVARDAVAVAPASPEVQLELALAEAANGDMVASRETLETALVATPGYAPIMVELAVLYDNVNDVAALESLAKTADRPDMDEQGRLFIQAWDLRRRNQFEPALALAEQISEAIHPVRRAHLMADLLDRLGRTDEAFDWFTRMNAAAEEVTPQRQLPTYRETIEAQCAAMQRVDPVVAPPAPQLSSPIFIVGFPRSGTTLLDTILMNADDVHVMEELPVLAIVEARREQMGTLDSLDEVALDELRALYTATASRLSPASAPARLVDKHPLHMAHVPLIARLFPGAPIILVERHPCDVVLSCFMANFKLNWAMCSFTSLDEAARTYAAVFDHWMLATARYPMNIHVVRYEDMVEDIAGVTRQLFSFLGLDWTPDVIDNQGAAKRRGHVRTASYSQVSEPIYRRALARWHRYRSHLGPILPILRPYVDRMGYTVD